MGNARMPRSKEVNVSHCLVSTRPSYPKQLFFRSALRHMVKYCWGENYTVKTRIKEFFLRNLFELTNPRLVCTLLILKFLFLKCKLIVRALTNFYSIICAKAKLFLKWKCPRRWLQKVISYGMALGHLPKITYNRARKWKKYWINSIIFAI